MAYFPRSPHIFITGILCKKAEERWRHEPAVLVGSAGADGRSLHRDSGLTGTIRGEEIFEEQREDLGAYRILLDRGSGSYYINMEEYLPGVVAMQMPVSYESEALRVQAIIARTYIRRQMEASGTFQSEAAVGETGVSQPEAAPAEGVSRPEPVREIAESALDLDYMEQEQLRRLWGTSEFPQYYQKLEQAVKSTEGMVLTYEGSLIDPMFFRLSAGMTREGDFLHPYFQNVGLPGGHGGRWFCGTQNLFRG